MTQTLMVYTNPQLRVADTEAGLATATETYECQINSARIDPTTAYNTVPATGCSGPTQSPGGTSWALNLTWLDDWAAPGGGLSFYAYSNRGQRKWVQLIPDKDDPTVGATGEVFIAPGGIGGVFGDGSAGQSTATWPFIGDPAFDVPAVALAATAGEDLERADDDAQLIGA